MLPATAHLLTPGRIAVPERLDPQTGATIPSFRLHDLACANGIPFDEAEAHGALADVVLTIEIAKLLRQKAPEAWTASLVAANCKSNV